MSKSDESAATSTKLVLPNGQKVSLGFQGGTFVTALVVAWQLWTGAAATLEKIETTSEKVDTIGERIDGMEKAIVDLAANEKRITTVEAENARLRSDVAQLQLDIAAALACARDKRKCP
jgi:hypothetical protein